jgi:hypothetical protein
MTAHDFPPLEVVYQRTRRWVASGCFEAIVHDLRPLVRMAAGRRPSPSVDFVDSRTLWLMVECGQSAGIDRYNRVCSSKVHGVVDTVDMLLA